MFEAGETWIIHEALELGRFSPALAEVKRLFEVTIVSQALLFVQLERYPKILLETAEGAAQGIRISGDDLEAAEREDELLYLPHQVMTLLHHHIALGTHSFYLCELKCCIFITLYIKTSQNFTGVFYGRSPGTEPNGKRASYGRLLRAKGEFMGVFYGRFPRPAPKGELRAFYGLRASYGRLFTGVFRGRRLRAIIIKHMYYEHINILF